MPKDLYSFYRLYSGKKRLTVEEKEAIFDAVLTGVKRTEEKSVRSWYRNRFFQIAAVASVSGLIVSILLFSGMFSGKADDNEFTVKGGDAMPEFDVTCSGGKDLRVCHLGDTLVFRAIPTSKYRYFAAFARNETTDTVVWYFPATSGGSCVPLSEDTKKSILREGVLIGNEHEKGKFDVFAWFFEKPCKRDDVRRAFESKSSRDTDGVLQLKATLEIR